MFHKHFFFSVCQAEQKHPPLPPPCPPMVTVNLAPDWKSVDPEVRSFATEPNLKAGNQWIEVGFKVHMTGAFLTKSDLSLQWPMIHSPQADRSALFYYGR